MSDSRPSDRALLRGCGTALVTPFGVDGAVDWDAFRHLVEWQIDSGIDFLIPCGTTGESVTLTPDEYRRVVRTCVETADKAVPIVAGAGSNNTAHAVEMARWVQDEGADAILSVCPYYNKPTQEGLYRHFEAVSRATDLPLVVYNVPGRTSSNLLPGTLERLWTLDSVRAVKEASGDLDQIMRIASRRPRGFSLLSGDDALTLPILSLGGDGVISVASNAIPAEMSGLTRAAAEGRWEEARDIHFRFLELMNLNFVESNPVPVKHVLSRMGRMSDAVRLPLAPLSPDNRTVIDAEIRRLGLIP